MRYYLSADRTAIRSRAHQLVLRKTFLWWQTMVVVNMFIFQEVTPRAVTMRKKVYGVGINDAPYKTHIVVDGHNINCKYYSRWCGILQRSYCPDYRLKHPTYEGTTVCDEWLTFSSFKAWMEMQNHEGLDLDKDLIQPGNTVYAPESCVFVSQHLNKLITTHTLHRGDLPIGVTVTRFNTFKARLNERGDRIVLGSFGTIEKASQAYNKAKSDHILEIADEQTDERIANGLRLHAQLYLEGKVR